MKWFLSTRAKLGLALGASSLVSVVLWLIGAALNDSTNYHYFIWNLALAWIPLGIALWLEHILHIKLWSSWSALLATFVWLLFLPNSFYVISGFVHLADAPRADLVFDVVMFTSFGMNGLILGFLSLFLVHSELRKRLSARTAGLMVSGVLLLSSLAIYIGRDLRWNSWDIILNPASLVFDVSDRLINAGSNPALASTTFAFFVLLGSIYLAVLYMARALRQQKTL